MRTVIEIWHTDKNGWKSNYFATRGVDYNDQGEMIPFDWWEIHRNMTDIHGQDDIDALRLMLNEIEKEINEDNNR